MSEYDEPLTMAGYLGRKRAIETVTAADEPLTRERAPGFGLPNDGFEALPNSGSGMRVSAGGVGILGTGGGYYTERRELFEAAGGGAPGAEGGGAPRRMPPPMGTLTRGHGEAGGLPGQEDFVLGGA